MEPVHFVALFVFLFLIYILYRSTKMQNKGSRIIDQSNELNERTLKIIERQERLIERHEKLMDRLDKMKIPSN